MLKQIFGLHAEPGREMRIILAMIPFVLLLLLYYIVSEIRLAENPSDKLMPSFYKMGATFWSLAFEPDSRSGTLLLWNDTAWSLFRLGAGLLLAAFFGLFLGLNMGLFPGLRAMGNPTVTVLSAVPPLALLAVILIVFGVGEAAKIVLIFIGTVFPITRSITLATEAIPREQITKALTLGASELGVVYRVILPQIMPHLVNAIRISLGAAWLFLIAAEALASENGLGYRIFLVRRYLSMDVILPYVAWITFLVFIKDSLLQTWMRLRYPWFGKSK